MTDIKKAFGIITDKLNETLKGQNFTQQKVESSNQNEIVNLFTSETVAYSVIYYKDKMLCVLRSCTMTEEVPTTSGRPWLHGCSILRPTQRKKPTA